MKARETELKKMFNAIALFLSENNCQVDCNQLKDQLFMLDFLGFEFLSPKQVLICFNNLEDLHKTGETRFAGFAILR